jgi:excisionase family DNA binding protein
MRKATDVLTAREAAAAKGVHLNSIYSAVKDGRLKGEKRGGVILILWRDLEKWAPVGHRPKSPRAK